MQEYSIYKKGEITVFLSFIFLVIIGFISIVILASREIYIRHKIEGVSDIAIRSSFSEYNKRLYDKYGLLYIDSTYLGSESGGEECLTTHIGNYVDVNLSEDANGNYRISLNSVEANNVVFADQHQYASIVSQIRTYMIENMKCSKTMTDDEILDSYIDLKMPENFFERFVIIEDENENNQETDYKDEATYKNKYYEPSYDEKLNEVINEIEKDIRETTNSAFSFKTQIECATVSIFYENNDGKIYECMRYYSLTL